jgi:hypothetical protein
VSATTKKQGMSTRTKLLLLGWGSVLVVFVLVFLWEHIIRQDDTFDSLCLAFVAAFLVVGVLICIVRIFAELAPPRQ